LQGIKLHNKDPSLITKRLKRETVLKLFPVDTTDTCCINWQYTNTNCQMWPHTDYVLCCYVLKNKNITSAQQFLFTLIL